MAYQIFDNMFPPSLVNDIENAFTSFEHNWHYMSSSSGVEDLHVDDDPLKKDCPQMIHVIYANEWVSQHSQLVKSMLYFIEDKTQTHIKSIHRIKANLTVPDGKGINYYNTPHVDHESKNFLSMVYYVHNTDGDTVLFDKDAEAGSNNLSILEKVSPARGKCVVFPSTQYHSSSNPIMNNSRIILNFIFEV